MRRFLLGLGLLAAAAAFAAPLRPPDPELGRRIYRDGILPSGRPLQTACASCHRRSGFGGSEGGVYVPPVTGPALFQPERLVRADLFRELYQLVQPESYRARVRDPRVRPGYTVATLATALREGRDPAGRRLDALMPRYPIQDADVAHLAAYLETLSAAPAPGVDGSAIHFATVITEGVDPGRRKALLDVLEGYVRWKNAETRHSAGRLGSSPWYRDEFFGSYREWRLHVWDLRGPAETWPAQLAALYRARPVFAVLSGTGAGSWRPLHEFCEKTELPCLFPDTDLPVVSPAGAYTLYLSKGLTVEAQALARFLAEEPPRRLLQVYRDLDEGREPAKVLRQALPKGIQLIDRVVAADQERTFWDDLIRRTRPDTLVLWLTPGDTASDALGRVRQVFLSHSLLGEEIPTELRGKVLLTSRYRLPGHEEPLAYRVRAWMRSRRIERTHERLQLNAYFALSVVDHSLVHVVENFSRDFLIESVEEETENALSPGVFPSLSLGPGQRFASQGSYVVKLSEKGELEPMSGWIVP